MSDVVRKVRLQRCRRPHWMADEADMIPLTASLPFYRSRRGEYVHRVRSGVMHILDGKHTHTSVGLWCGANGFLGKKGYLMADAPGDEPMCATCEGRAIGAGLEGTRRINGRFVLYRPRV